METKEVVINVCHGGFGLSALAISEIAKRKGITAYFFECKYSPDKSRYESLSIEAADNGRLSVFAFSVPNPNDYELFQKDGEENYKESNERFRKISIEYDDNREDKDLVAV